MNKKKHLLIKAILVLGTMLGAHSAFACQYLPLVPNIIAGIQNHQNDPVTYPTVVPTPNTTVCVDVPVALFKGNKIVWNMDTPVTGGGVPMTTPGVTPAGLRHMWMMAIANNAFATKNSLDKSTFHIYGVIHGSALHWALSDKWWEAQVDKFGNQLYPNGNPIGPWIKKVLAMKNTGLDVQLEVCGVTLMGAHLSSDDVYPGIKVNQGAFGRFEALHQDGYLVIQEGWEDNDSAYLEKTANN